ncbi:MAG: hypothetical protein HY855_22770 [Burkholderiales bacterium]|nr:hypothetical protein [Burkholderiales bacterium]
MRLLLHTPIARLAATVAMAITSLPAPALTVVAGNAKLTVPDDQRWEVHELADPDIQIDSGASTTPSMSRVLRLSEGAQTLAVVHVSGSIGGNIGETVWHFKCPVDQQETGSYVRDRAHKYNIDCLTVDGPVDLDRSIQQFDARLARLLGTQGAMPGGAGYFIWSIYASGTARVKVLAVVRGNFAGAPTAQTTGEDTQGIPAEVLEWGRQLNDQVRSSVLSISGRFTLPRMEFRR